jgi:uncharacterized protein YjiS (DUF1127 family)
MSQTITKFHLALAPLSWQDRVALVWHRISTAWQVAATRRQLSQLDDRALSDIGISRAQAQFEVERPVWQLVPGNCR